VQLELGGKATSVSDDPAPHASSVQHYTHDAAELEALGQVRGYFVSKGLVDPAHVGEDLYNSTWLSTRNHLI
jgi:hypothetical protein